MKRIIVALVLVLVMVSSSCAGNKTAKKPVDASTEAVTTKHDDSTPQGPVTVTLKVGSYNVKHFEQVNHDFSVIAQDITSKNLEIVGLQEIDSVTTRSNKLDEPKLIAEALGWKYYAFAKAIGYQGGGYGHCIVSKYPIKSFAVVDLPGTGEHRVIGHAVIDVNGVEINFINTHLSHESRQSRVEQFATIAAYVKELDNFIIVGDFNTEDFTEFAPIENATLLNNEQRSIKTFPASEPTSAIDNIVVSPMFTLGRPKELLNQNSDHIMLFTEVTYVLEKTE